MGKLLLPLSFLLLSPLCAAEGLSSLDDASLSDVSGQAGIAIDLVAQINSDASGNPLASLSSCVGTSNPCHVAFQFHNRGSGGGEWMVWKDFFGILKFNNVWLDAGQTSSTASAYPDTATANRFMNGATCLPDSAKTAATCYQAVLGKPMMSMQLNQGNAGGLQLFLHLGRVSVEYGATGYDGDARLPALGVLVGDIRGTDLATPTAYPAQAKIGGKIGLYGF